MKITKIELRNFKGRSGTWELPPAAVIVGSNLSGKTAITLGLRFALTGGMPPPLGRANQGMWRVAGHGDRPGEAGVVLTFDDGVVASAVLKRTASGSVSVELGVPNDRRIPELLVEPATYFGLTRTEKIAAVFAACDLDSAAIRDGLKRALRGNDSVKGRQGDELLEAVLKTVDGADWSTPSAALEGISAGFDAIAKAAKQSAERMAAQLAAARSLRENPPRNPTDEELAAAEAAARIQQPPDNAAGAAELAAAERELNSLSFRLAQAEAAYQAANAAAAEPIGTGCPVCKRRWRKADREGMERARQEELKTRATEWATLKAQLDQASAKVAEIKARHEAAAAEARRARAQWAEEVRAASARLEQLRSERRAWLEWKRADDEFIRLGDQCGAFELKALYYKAAAKIATAFMQQAARDAVAGLMGMANELIEGLLPTPLELREGQLGRVAGADEPGVGGALAGSWIPHEAFSGAESMLAYAAFAYAITRRQRGPRVLVLDELGRMTRDKQLAALARLDAAVRDGRLDQFIGCLATPSELRVIAVEEATRRL